MDAFSDRTGWVPGDDTEPRRFPLIPFNKIEINRSAPYFVRGILPREGLAVVWGPPKCGKSFWTLDLALHVAMGREYRDRRVAQAPVVYVACEGERGLNNRILAWRNYNADAPADLPFWLLPTRLDLAAEHETLVADIRAQVPTPPGIVVIDTLNRSISGSESKDEDMGAYIRGADAIRAAFNCLVIVIHHCGTNDTRPRGHTSLTGAADAQIAVTKAGDVISAAVEYMKDGEAGATIASTLAVIDLDWDEDGEPITSCAIEPAEPPAAKQSPPKSPPLSPNETIALRCLDTVLKANAIVATVGDKNTERPVVREADWRARFYAEGKPGETADTKKKAFRRALDSLLAKQRIAAENDFVWRPDTW